MREVQIGSLISWIGWARCFWWDLVVLNIWVEEMEESSLSGEDLINKIP